ncbi:hypothetical protein RJ640_009318 [Escallonia rubra]|uniref:Retrotransposon Copia-like N-terminal domain-containing protein n=1 Tax=Escallonia rubra TaxID=112253 RepID=A0AA88QVD7_9ASTE|nr:hypothetical protein RJ640_009318 [Escallonia rubra]
MAEDDGKDATQRKTISPYDLTTNDNPGIIITQVQVKGENYDEWARSIRTAMIARKKFGFIDRTIKRPDENSLDLEDWCTINSLLVSWIRNTIEPTLRSTISHVEVAQDLWTIIKERFSVVNGPRIQQLKTELADCKHKGLTIVNYYGKLKMLWDELANFEQMPTCKCGKCTCDLGSVLEKKREEEKVINSSWDPLPNLNRVYSTLIQEERVKTIARGKEERGEVMVFAAQSTAPTEVKVDRRTRMWCAPTANTLDMSRRTVSYSLATVNGGAIVLVVMGKQVAVVEDNNSKRWDIVEVVDEVEHRVQMLFRQQEKDLPSQQPTQWIQRAWGHLD